MTKWPEWLRLFSRSIGQSSQHQSLLVESIWSAATSLAQALCPTSVLSLADPLPTGVPRELHRTSSSHVRQPAARATRAQTILPSHPSSFHAAESMSPPPGQDAASALKAQNRRSASGSASPRPTAGDGTKAPKSSSGGARQTPTPTPTSVHYTLLIRLPFARGAFEDPPQVCIYIR